MTAVEVLAADDTPVRTDATPLRVPAGQSSSENVVTDLDWSLSSFGRCQQRGEGPGPNRHGRLSGLTAP